VGFCKQGKIMEQKMFQDEKFRQAIEAGIANERIGNEKVWYMLKQSKTTNSIYITLYFNGQKTCVRFSDHSSERYLGKKCMFRVCLGRKRTMT